MVRQHHHYINTIDGKHNLLAIYCIVENLFRGTSVRYESSLNSNFRRFDVAFIHDEHFVEAEQVDFALIEKFLCCVLGGQKAGKGFSA